MHIESTTTTDHDDDGNVVDEFEAAAQCMLYVRRTYIYIYVHCKWEALVWFCLPIADCCRHGCASASHSTIWNLFFLAFISRALDRQSENGGMVALCVVFSVSVASAFDAAQYFNAFSRIIYHIRTCVCVRLCGKEDDVVGWFWTFSTHLRACHSTWNTHTKHRASLSIVCCHVCRIQLWMSVVYVRWLITTSPFHLTNRFRNIFFACTDVVCASLPSISILANIISHRRRRCELTIRPGLIVVAVESFSLVCATTKIQKRIANEANLAFYWSQCK